MRWEGVGNGGWEREVLQGAPVPHQQWVSLQSPPEVGQSPVTPLCLGLYLEVVSKFAAIDPFAPEQL